MALATLTIDINAKLANIERDLGRAAQVAEKNGRRIESAFSSAGAALATLGAGLGAGAFMANIKGIIDGADQLNKASQKYGVAVEQLSALSYAGKLSDVSLEAIGTGLKKLSVNMLDTAAGTGEAKEAFKALGIEVKNADGGLKSSDEVLGQIADRFAGMEDGAGKTALAVKLFGKAGADLIPLLNQGSKGLRDMKEEAERLGVIVGGDLAKKSEEFNDNLTRISASLDAVKIALLGGVIDKLNDLTAALVASTKAAGGFWKGLLLLDGSQSENPVAALEEVEGSLQRLKKIKKEIEESSANRSAFRDVPFLGTAGDLKNLENQIATLEKRRAALADLSKQRGAFEFGPPVWGGKEKAPVPQDDGKLKKSADDARKAFEEATKAIYDNALAAAEADAEIEKLRDHYTDLVDPAARTMRELAKFEEIAPALGLTADQVERIRDAFREKIDVEQYGKPLKDITEDMKDQKDLAKDLGLTFQSAFEDAVISGKKFSDVLKGLAQDIARIVLRKTVTEPLGNAIGSMLQNILPSFGGGRASGGAVYPGQYYVVGERGPEVLVPNSAGTVIPNGAGGGGVVVNIIEAPGSGGQVARRQDPGGMDILDIFVEKVKGAVAGDIARGGLVADSLQNTYGLNRAAGAWR